MRVTDTHVYFWGSYLSNFYWAPFYSTVNFPLGTEYIEFHSSEQHYMVQKAMFFKDYECATLIIKAPDAKSAKALGRKVRNFDEKQWYDASYPAMSRSVYLKFIHNTDICNKLINTGDRILVEASPSDNIWGVGLHEDDDAILDKNNWTGENRLGLVLMDVRSAVKEGK